MNCIKCGKRIPPGAKFCPFCAIPVNQEKENQVLFCTVCGEKLRRGAKFCVRCGTRTASKEDGVETTPRHYCTPPQK